MLIAPFWNEHLYSYPYDQIALFRKSDDEKLLNSVGSSISKAFFSAFSPSSLFVATWVEIDGPLQNNVTKLIINFRLCLHVHKN